MPFVEMDGVTGKVYVPEKPPGTLKKHDCKECFSCQMCGDDRCNVCRRGGEAGRGDRNAQRRCCVGGETKR